MLIPAGLPEINTHDNLQLAYDLGRRALHDYPDCDGLYISGGVWLAEPAAYALENEFCKRSCASTAAIRGMMILLDDWKPMPGRGRLLATP